MLETTAEDVQNKSIDGLGYEMQVFEDIEEYNLTQSQRVKTALLVGDISLSSIQNVAQAVLLFSQKVSTAPKQVISNLTTQA